MIKNDKMRFVLRVTVAHIVTYIVCGMFFSTVFRYQDIWQAGGFGDHMRDYDSIFIYLGPLFQIIRGLLFGGILILIPIEFFKQKYGWLKLWIIVAGIGILNTPGPSLGSIEGLIYTTTPLESYTGCIEIYVQTLWFSWLVCRAKKEAGKSLAAKYKYPLIAACITAAGISLSGILIAAIKGVSPMSGAEDFGALLLLLLSAAVVFITTVWYIKKPIKRTIVFLLVCYLSNGVFSVVYNYLTASPFQSLLPLLGSLVFTSLIWILVRPKS